MDKTRLEHKKSSRHYFCPLEHLSKMDEISLLSFMFFSYALLTAQKAGLWFLCRRRARDNQVIPEGLKAASLYRRKNSTTSEALDEQKKVQTKTKKGHRVGCERERNFKRIFLLVSGISRTE